MKNGNVGNVGNGDELEVRVIWVLNADEYLAIGRAREIRSYPMENLIDILKSGYVVIENPTSLVGESTFAFQAVLDLIEKYDTFYIYKLILYNVGQALSWHRLESDSAYNFSYSRANDIRIEVLGDIDNWLKKSKWHLLFCLSYSRMFRMEISERDKLFADLQEQEKVYLAGEHTRKSNHIMTIGMGAYLSYSETSVSSSIDKQALLNYYQNSNKFNYIEAVIFFRKENIMTSEELRLIKHIQDNINDIILSVAISTNYGVLPMRIASYMDGDDRGYFKSKVTFMAEKSCSLELAIISIKSQQQVDMGSVKIIDFSDYMEAD